MPLGIMNSGKQAAQGAGCDLNHKSFARYERFDGIKSPPCKILFSGALSSPPYPHLPAPLAGGPTDVCKNNGICTPQPAKDSENGLAPEYYKYLLTGGTGLTNHTPDTRIRGVLGTPPYSKLPAGPFQLTNADSFPYDAYAASPAHRFYPMWQQLDCNVAYGFFPKKKPS